MTGNSAAHHGPYRPSSARSKSPINHSTMQGLGPWERAIYLTVLGAATVSFTYEGYQLSRQYGAGGRLAGKLAGLRPGWLFGKSVDLSDIQWRSLRGSLAQLTAVFSLFALISRTVQAYHPAWRCCLSLALGLAYLAYCHGSFLMPWLALVLGNYALVRAAAAAPPHVIRYGPAAVWVYNCSALLMVKVYGNMRWQQLSPALAWMDAWRGALRWDVVFNLTTLRCISYGCDALWAASASSAPAAVAVSPSKDRGGSSRSSSSSSSSGGGGGSVCAAGGRAGGHHPPAGHTPGAILKARAEAHLPGGWRHYSLQPYLAYLTYPPLYFSGPISTYNAFASQMMVRPPALRPAAVVHYALRWLLCWLVLEGVTHTMYYNAMARGRVWARHRPGSTAAGEWGPLQLSLIGFWVLLFMWLKFTVTWRFARCASLASGIDVPENIGRCVCNNYDIAGFWRNWHCSFNLWLVRYVYIPLGGSAWRLLNVWPTFVFVALWHDLEPHLLGWALLTCTMFVPEMAAKWAVSLPAARPLCKRGVLFRHVCAAGATVNIVMLMTANLVGFVVGVDGVKTFLWQVLQRPRYLATVLAVIYCTAHLMLDLRVKEQAAGGRRVCPLPNPYKQD